MSIFLKLYTLLDHSECVVNNSKRFMAYLLDWFLGSLCTLFPMCMLWVMWTHNVETMSDANVLYIAGQIGDTQAYLAGFLCIIFALFYYVIIPWKLYPGQTLGKRAMNFKIVKKDGSDVTLKTLLIRQVLGIFIIEGALYSVSGILHSILSLAFDLNFINIMKFVGLGIGVLSGFLMLKVQSRRMLHDYLAGTKVIPFVAEERVDERI